MKYDAKVSVVPPSEITTFLGGAYELDDDEPPSFFCGNRLPPDFLNFLKFFWYATNS